MEAKTALERLAAGEAVHPDDLTDAELLALLPNFAPTIRRVTLFDSPAMRDVLPVAGDESEAAA